MCLERTVYDTGERLEPVPIRIYGLRLKELIETSWMPRRRFPFKP